MRRDIVLNPEAVRIAFDAFCATKKPPRKFDEKAYTLWALITALEAYENFKQPIEK